MYGLWASDLALEIFGEDAVLGQADLEPLATAMIMAPGAATAGGSNEIQRNIIGERILGLAKDPGVDRDTPFNELRLSS
jgi:alkylation response protein AidB-like acyl-CoA dehydrogenase